MKLKCFESTDSNGTEQYLIPLEDGSFIAVPKATTYGDALRAVKEQPSIDIVRCKECRWGKPYSDKQLECDALGLGGLKFPDDFCSYGEREGE